MRLFLCLSIALSASISLRAEDPKDEKNVRISLLAFEDMVSEPARNAEAAVLNGRKVPPPEERRQLNLPISSKALKLWMDVIPALEANANPPREHEPIFPPGLADAIAKADQVPIADGHIFDAIERLQTLAAAVATPAEGRKSARTVSVPRQWLDEMFRERERLARNAVEQMRKEQDPADPVVVRRDDGTFAHNYGRALEKVAEADVPEEGPVFCAPFGKNGTWNLYQVINKPTTWLEAELAATKMPAPLGAGGPSGHLASIHSAAENAFITRIAEGTRMYWIGLNDLRLETGHLGNGPWEWTSGEPVTWRNWSSFEPDCGAGTKSNNPDEVRTDEDGVAVAGTLRMDSIGRWADMIAGTMPGSRVFWPYVVEWNVNAPAPIPGAHQLAASFPNDLEGPTGGEGKFGVRLAYEGRKCASLAEAIDNYRVGKARVTNAELSVIHHCDSNQIDVRGLIEEFEPWPGEKPGEDKNAAFLCRGRIHVAEAGTYTFNVHHNDGFALRIKGGRWKAAHGTAVVDLGDPATLVSYWLVQDFAGSRGVIELAAGDHEIEFFGFQSSGRFYFELAAAKGEFAEDTDTNLWRLVGQPSRGKVPHPGVTDGGWTVEITPPNSTTRVAFDVAERALDKKGRKLPAGVPFLSYRDPDYSWWGVAKAQPFPDGVPGVDDDNFAMRARAVLEIPADGTYWIGYNATSSGRLRIPSQKWKRLARGRPNEVTLEDDLFESLADHEWAQMAIGEIELKAGLYPIEFLTVQGKGRAHAEVFAGAAGLPASPLRVGGALVIDDPGGLLLVK
jgi:hypothetical protein